MSLHACIFAETKTQYMLKEFKEFAFKGNVLDLAVATVLGAAFNSIVGAVVDNILMPIVGILTGGKNFDTMVVAVGDAQLKYGTAITALVKFIIVALFLFMVIKAANKMKKPADDAAPAPPTPSEEYLKSILEELKKK